jgi:hypothetical protein
LTTTILSFVANPTRGYVNDTITFYANASSDTGSALNFTIYFDSMLPDYTNNTASPSYSTTTPNPGNVVTNYTYDRLGTIDGTSGTYFRVRLYVGDGSNVVTTAISVYIVENSAPVFNLELPNNVTISPGVESTFTTIVADVDDDSLTVTWDFGDGSTFATNLTGPAADGVSVTQSHTWDPYLEPGIGNYFIQFVMTVTVEDPLGHIAQFETILSIYVPWNFSPVWSLWVDSLFVDPSDEIRVYGSATDREGDPMTWTFMVSNETAVLMTEVAHTPATEPNATVLQNFTTTLGAEGSFTVKVWLTDALLPELQTGSHNLSKSILLTSTVNTMPFALANITFSPLIVYLDNVSGMADVTLSMQANDVDGDVLTVTWGFGDGSDPAVNYSSGGIQVYTFYQLHRYNSSGIFCATCTITDGRPGHEVVRNGTLIVRSDNRPPTVKAILMEMSQGSFALVNTTINFTLVLNDLEGDPVEIWWDFGDNSTIGHSFIDAYGPDGNGTSTVNHSYEQVEEYTLHIWFTDHRFDTSWHNTSLNATVSVQELQTVPILVWDWWDTTSLTAFIGSIIAVVAYTLYVRNLRRKLDNRGMTLEEYKIVKAEDRAGRKGRFGGDAKDDGEHGKTGGR